MSVFSSSCERRRRGTAARSFCADAVAGAFVVLAIVGRSASAQVPAPAPAVATGSLAGVVRDVGGTPLPDVTVTLVGESAAARTDTAGRFVLYDVPAGSHTALFRRIGYRSVEYRWTARADRGLEVAVTMTPVPRALERVVVEAPGASRRRGTSSIAGTVSDSSGRGVAGADVRLLGAGLSTLTDSNGTFEFQLLAAGSYIVRARRPGLTSGNYVMQIADDDNRGITLKLYGLPRKTGARDTAVASGFGVADMAFEAFDRRARTSFRYPTLGPADLFRRQGMPLDLVLQQYRDERVTPSSEEGDCLIVDGRRASYQPLRTFTTLEMQMVEIFRKNAFVDEYIVSQMDGVRECRGTMDRHPPYFVLWTRRLR
jgi:hypothetical protein